MCPGFQNVKTSKLIHHIKGDRGNQRVVFAKNTAGERLSNSLQHWARGKITNILVMVLKSKTC